MYLETLNIEKGQIDPKHNRRVKGQVFSTYSNRTLQSSDASDQCTTTPSN